MPRKRTAWRHPSEIQNHPNSGGSKVQVRFLNGRCKFMYAGKVDWTTVIEWRFK